MCWRQRWALCSLCSHVSMSFWSAVSWEHPGSVPLSSSRSLLWSDWKRSMTFFFRKNNYLLCTSTGLSKISSMKLDISGSTVWEKNQQPWPLQTSLRHMDGAAAVPAFSLVLKHARHCRTFAQAVLMLWMHVLCALSPHGLSQLLIGIWSRIIFITDITWHQSGSHWSSATYVSNTLCSWTVSCMQAQSHQG